MLTNVHRLTVGALQLSAALCSPSEGLLWTTPRFRDYVTLEDFSSAIQGDSRRKILHMSFYKCASFTNVQLSDFAQGLPHHLEELKLNLMECVGISDAGLGHRKPRNTNGYLSSWFASFCRFGEAQGASMAPQRSKRVF